MAAPRGPAPPPTPPKPPLGLPAGSVRAVLALILCGTLWYLILRDRTVPPLLASAVLLVVAFYFGVRSSVPFSAPTTAPAGTIPQPLYLPRGAVRTLLLGGFLAIIVYVWSSRSDLPVELVLIFQVLVSYLVGFATAALLNRRIAKGPRPNRPVAIVRNLVALLALGVTGVVCSSILFGIPGFVPTDAEKALAWTVAFYFGSRLGP